MGSNPFLGYEVGEKMNAKIIDIPKNDCNITTVEAEFDRAMAYVAPCFGRKIVDENPNGPCSRCERVKECSEATGLGMTYEQHFKMSMKRMGY